MLTNFSILLVVDVMYNGINPQGYVSAWNMKNAPICEAIVIIIKCTTLLNSNLSI